MRQIVGAFYRISEALLLSVAKEDTAIIYDDIYFSSQLPYS
jgi:hypothetical protein